MFSGRPAIRDHDSTTCSGAIETAEATGNRIYVEAWKRGWRRVEKTGVIGDGAEWIWNIAPTASEQAPQLYPNRDAEQKRWMTTHQDMLDEGGIEDLGAALRSIHSSNPELTEETRKDVAYIDPTAIPARETFPETLRREKKVTERKRTAKQGKRKRAKGAFDKAKAAERGP